MSCLNPADIVEAAIETAGLAKGRAEVVALVAAEVLITCPGRLAELPVLVRDICRSAASLACCSMSRAGLGAAVGYDP